MSHKIEKEGCKYEQPKISIRHAIWNTTLIVQTLHCEPFLTTSNGFEISFTNSTFLGKHYANFGCGEGNVNTDTIHFDTQSEAQSYLDTLLELVEMVNNPVPVVDLNSYGIIKIGEYSIRITGEGYTYILHNYNTNLAFWNKWIPKKIIKQQLEQILEHLGVKAEVRI